MTVSGPLPSGTVGTDEVTEVTADDATKGFSQSIMISAVRCLFTYILLPFATPLFGLADIGPYIGIPLGLVAVAANLYSIRRFFAADHPWKWYVTFLHVGVLILLAFLLVNDLRELVS